MELHLLGQFAVQATATEQRPNPKGEIRQDGQRRLLDERRTQAVASMMRATPRDKRVQ
jgi:hypothetical protein